jgi:hypothetical protein
MRLFIVHIVHALRNILTADLERKKPPAVIIFSEIRMKRLVSRIVRFNGSV